METKNCMICGKEFLSGKNQGGYKYCSESCKNKSVKTKETNRYQRLRTKKYNEYHRQAKWKATKEVGCDQWERISELVEEMGVSWQEFARGCGIPVQTIQNFYYNGQSLGFNNILKIATHTNKSLDWLYGLDKV